MGKVNHTEDLASRIKTLEARLAALERGRPIASGAVSQGSFEVRTPDGDVILRVGEVQYGDQIAYGMTLFRQNGTRQARFFDTPGGGGYWSFFDETGNIVLSEDTVSGIGLAVPYLAYQSMPYSQVLTPPVLTTSATFEKLHRIHSQKWQPWVRTYLIVDTEPDTTGQVILTQNSSQISTTLDIPTSSNGYYWLDAPVGGNHGEMLNIDVEARRTAGTGSVRVGIAVSSGRQS